MDMAGNLSAQSIERLLAERTRRLAERERPADTTPHAHVAVCRVGREFYGLDLALCGAVVDYRGSVPMRGGHPALLGVVSHHGQTFGVVDLAVLIGLGRGGSGEDHAHLVFLRRNRGIALRVDRVVGTYHLPLTQSGPQNRAAARDAANVTSYALAPAGTVGEAETVVSILDLARLLKPVHSPSGA